tara:strand:+ start:1438 stop:1839 length:402 start_codon:yes stop_codon:yes gene_type:complete
MSSRSINQKILANMVLHKKQTNNDEARLNTLYRGFVKMYENVNKERKFTDRSKVQKDLTNIRKKMREVENDMKKLKEKKKFIESELRRLRKEIPGRNKNYANRIAALKKSNYIKPSASKLLKKELGMNKNNKK